MSQSTRIGVRFPGHVWQGIVAVAVAEGIPPTMWVVRACVDRLEGNGSQDAYVAPGDAIPAARLRDSHDTLIRP